MSTFAGMVIGLIAAGIMSFIFRSVRNESHRPVQAEVREDSRQKLMHRR